jgi:hypothetical protein
LADRLPVADVYRVAIETLETLFRDGHNNGSEEAWLLGRAAMDLANAAITALEQPERAAEVLYAALARASQGGNEAYDQEGSNPTPGLSAKDR